MPSPAVAHLGTVALVVLSLTACRDTARDIDASVAEVDAARVPSIRFATFNVRRFFDTVCESGACTSGDYELQLSPAQFDARALQLATAIQTLDADVVALQELETQACLDALLAHLGDSMPHGVLGETSFASSVDVAIVSRTPIESVIGHRDANLLELPGGSVTTFSRELLEVHTHAADGTPLIAFAAHFKSKSNDDPPRRLAEAQVSARIVNEVAAQNPAALVVLGGDLNDTPGSPPLDALTVEGQLVRVADDLPADGQVTYVYRGAGRAIDHLLLAPTEAAVRRIPLSSRSWRAASGGWGGSDHFALTSDFTLLP